ncbi:[bacterium]|nr:[FeFe] hydrogenase H-cluster maturation GTPase HydF [bacterium]
MKTLKSDRLHIGIFGRTNVGKSSILNKITGQDVSIVSDMKGTTTDVVEKSMELLPIGPVTFLDTAGLDDTTQLAQKRIEKTLKILDRADIVLLVTDKEELTHYENELIDRLKDLNIPYITIVNKYDNKEYKTISNTVLYTSALYDDNFIYRLKNMLIKVLPDDFVNQPKIAGDLVPEKSTVILVVPIDKEAPKGRIILPQVQTLRDLLDSNCLCYVVKDTELEGALNNLKEKPSLVITDSQAFKKVSEIVPDEISLTSFSILFARLKGDLKAFVNGAKAIDNLNDGDKVLILESCTHHAIEDDIGTVKIPALLRKRTGKNLIIDNFSGHEFPDIKDYKLIIHCGACMTNRREVLSRILYSSKQNIPITNYGIAISYCLGILDKAIKIFNIV